MPHMKSFRRASACFGRLLFPVPWGSLRLQGMHELGSHRRYAVHRLLKCLLVELGWLVETAHLAHELQRRGLGLCLGDGRIEIEEHLDVAAHGMGPLSGVVSIPVLSLVRHSL